MAARDAADACQQLAQRRGVVLGLGLGVRNGRQRLHAKALGGPAAKQAAQGLLRKHELGDVERHLDALDPGLDVHDLAVGLGRVEREVARGPDGPRRAEAVHQGDGPVGGVVIDDDAVIENGPVMLEPKRQ